MSFVDKLLISLGVIDFLFLVWIICHKELDIYSLESRVIIGSIPLVLTFWLAWLLSDFIVWLPRPERIVSHLWS